ncbi:MAG: DUF3786 domain-containing protein [Ruminococcus sp.]|jgi:hypothetical protein
MSVNYHAFQSRGVVFADSEALSQQWWDKFADYDPSRIAGILNLAADEQYLYLTYFQMPYRLNLSNGHLEKQKDGEWNTHLFFNETMAIYHLLWYTVDHPVLSGQWVPGHALDGVVSRNGNFPDPLLTPFAKKFEGKAKKLDEICRMMGGIKLEKGDVSYEFEAFPQIKLRMVFWEADEDFPAQVQVLVDKRVTDFIHFETVGCLISDLFEKLEEQL